MSIVVSDFRPRRAFGNPHLQTVLASKAVRPPPVATRAERLELDDGDFVDLAHGPRPKPRDERGRPLPRVVLFHGLAGSVASPYVQGAIGALAARGFATTLMHWRGCSGEPNRLARSYHSGASDDVARVVDVLAARQAGAALHAVGFSLGGNALLKYLGERGEDTPLAAAVAVCPPLVLEVGATRLDRGLARGYRRYLLGRMRAQHEAKRARYPALGLPPAPPSLDSFWRFDDALTAPLHGFRDVHDYYARCGARRHLGGIRRPTHILAARDDPFFTEEILPEAHELAPGTTLELAARGGHVGFLGRGAGLRPRRWLDGRIAEIVAGFQRLDAGRRPARA